MRIRRPEPFSGPPNGMPRTLTPHPTQEMPSDEWARGAPRSTLTREDASQRERVLRDGFNTPG